MYDTTLKWNVQINLALDNYIDPHFLENDIPLWSFHSFVLSSWDGSDVLKKLCSSEYGGIKKFLYIGQRTVHKWTVS